MCLLKYTYIVYLFLMKFKIPKLNDKSICINGSTVCSL